MKNQMAIAALIVASNIGAQTTSKILIDTRAERRVSSPLHYGIFIEDWSHQIEGGIYGEMLRNLNFDDTNSSKEVLLVGFPMDLPEEEVKGSKQIDKDGNLIIPGWVIENKKSQLMWATDESAPINANNPRCLLLKAESISPQSGIYNSGHCTNVQGLAVKKGTEYRFSCYVKTAIGGGELSVRIEKPNGEVLAESTLLGLTNRWQQMELMLKSEADYTGARLYISPKEIGSYYLDMVSLFPKECWKGRPNGLNPNLMEFAAALKPAFVRFPGGCFVEGLGVLNSWMWKSTIGPIEERPGHWNIWGWRSSDGMGYHEYLQMCEDLRAEPIHVVNDGISHDKTDAYNGKYEYVPMEEMGSIVQDALDAIEYANGDTSTKWGAYRAKNGHPEPFNLKYIEIGNENHGTEYAERYALIHDAIRQKYPEIQLIMDSWGANNYPRNRVPDVLDIHRFADREWFALNYGMFDNYPRTGHKIYFGEWCVNLENKGKETLETGLYEAAFMAGLEKNSDLVVMQSYAPFMKNMGWRAGKPNMVMFDLDRVYGAPVYWLQKMFSDNRVDSLYQVSSSSPVFPIVKEGLISLNARETELEYKDLSIQSNGSSVVNGVGELVKKGTGWVVSGGIAQNNGISSADLETSKEFGGEFTINVKAKRKGGKHGFQITFAGKEKWLIGENNKVAKIFGEIIENTKIVTCVLENDRWYDLRLEVTTTEACGYIDGVLVSTGKVKQIPSLYVSAGYDKTNQEVVLKVVNIGATPQSTEIKIPNISIEKSASLTILSSDNGEITNTLEQPNRIVPRQETIQSAASTFIHQFPPYSASIIRLKTNSTAAKTELNLHEKERIVFLANRYLQIDKECGFINVFGISDTTASILSNNGLFDVGTLPKGCYLVSYELDGVRKAVKFVK